MFISRFGRAAYSAGSLSAELKGVNLVGILVTIPGLTGADAATALDGIFKAAKVSVGHAIRTGVVEPVVSGNFRLEEFRILNGLFAGAMAQADGAMIETGFIPLQNEETLSVTVDWASADLSALTVTTTGATVELYRVYRLAPEIYRGVRCYGAKDQSAASQEHTATVPNLEIAFYKPAAAGSSNLTGGTVTVDGVQHTVYPDPMLALTNYGHQHEGSSDVGVIALYATAPEKAATAKVSMTIEGTANDRVLFLGRRYHADLYKRSFAALQAYQREQALAVKSANTEAAAVLFGS